MADTPTAGLCSLPGTGAGDGALVDSVLRDPDARRLLVEWNESAAEYPMNRCLHQLFEAEAERNPDAPAVVFEDEVISYGDLNERSNRLAHWLIDQGVGPDVLVGMYFERGPEAIVSLLAILKAGGAYVALDTALPEERVRFMLEDARVSALVTLEELTSSVEGLSLPVLCLDARDALADQPTTNPDVRTSAENLVYVIYTSGSTGRPKGVAIEHRQVINYVYGLRERVGFTPGASYATVSTLSADLGNTVVFSALAWGGCLHVISKERIFNGDALASYFLRHRIDCLKITPSHLAALQNIPEPEQVMPRRWLILGGEASYLPWVDELRRIAPECEIFNHYGPTETTIGVLTFAVASGVPQTNSGTLVLGRPLPNAKMYVVDAGMSLVPVGEPGELLIGGAGLARGYLHRPELTDERFIPSPFGEGRVYRTGDLVRYLPDGNIEFLGRIDDQVKIRGNRVELGEIESELARHPDVTACVVLARDDGQGQKRLVAYVVSPEMDTERLQGHLRQSLPDYMIPGAFVRLDDLPLNANGKVDRQALPDPSTEVRSDARPYVPPSSDTENWLAREWDKLLGLERIGIDDDFFELGGHSLLAVRLFTAVRRTYKVDLPLAALVQAPTIRSLAELIEQRRPRRQATISRNSGADSVAAAEDALKYVVPIKASGSRPPFFLVHAIGGNVLKYYDLARHLDEDQPFYGIQAQGVDGLQRPLCHIAEMAAAYLQEIRRVQPEGPYYIGGYCAGGPVAFELAHQLRSQGEQIASLVFFDAWSPRLFDPGGRRHAPPPPEPTTRPTGRLQRHLGRLLAEGPGHLFRWLKGRVIFEHHRLVQLISERVKPRARMKQLADAATVKLCRVLRRPLPYDLRWEPIRVEMISGLDQYELRPLSVDLSLFVASERLPWEEYAPPDLGWTQWIDGELTIERLPGYQATMLDPEFAQGAAERLQHHLRRRSAMIEGRSGGNAVEQQEDANVLV